MRTRPVHDRTRPSTVSGRPAGSGAGAHATATAAVGPAVLAALAVLAGLAALAVLVAPARPAGAGDEPPVRLEGRTNDEGTTSVERGKVRIDAVDFAFDATFVETDGGRVKVKLRNRGDVTHTFTIDALDVDETLAPGKKAKVKVRIRADDTDPTVFYCRFHRSSGMQGALFTEAAAQAANAGSTTAPSTTAPSTTAPSTTAPSTTRSGSGSGSGSGMGSDPYGM